MANETPGTLGPWTLHEKLGSGGNATVWRATRAEIEQPVAVKVLNAHRAGREPYRRFVREIAFLRSLADPAGVLPLLDAYLPEKPTKDDRPWLAMPIATLIADALAGQPLETVVVALADIAGTLARLADQHALGHRDIKPDNLYELDGRWLVGDFGLIAAPNLDALTRTGRPLGPAHYTAYELIRDPTAADPLPADVYSFGKTLWVLATEQRFPPEGHQAAATRQFSIADLRPHPHAAPLDQLVDRATRIHADQRPTMTEVASDLRAWGELAAEPVAVDVTELRTRLLERMSDEFAAEDLLEQRKEFAMAAVRRMNELFAPLNAALKNVHPRAQIDIGPDRFTQNMLSTSKTLNSPDIVFKFQRLSQITSGPDYRIFALRLGRSIELTAEGGLIFRSYVDVGNPKTMGHSFNWHSKKRTAPVGSVQAEVMLHDGVTETGCKLTEGLEAFIQNLPERH